MLLARVLAHDRIPGISTKCDVWGAIVLSLGTGVCIPTDALRSPASCSGMCRPLFCSGYKAPFGSDLSGSGGEWARGGRTPTTCSHKPAVTKRPCLVPKRWEGTRRGPGRGSPEKELPLCGPTPLGGRWLALRVGVPPPPQVEMPPSPFHCKVNAAGHL